MNPQLIEQIKQGTPLEYDIDNVELLRKVLKEAAPNCHLEPNGLASYYYIKDGIWHPYYRADNAITLSSFIEPKMVEVDVIRKWITDNTETATTQSGDKITFVHVEDINNFLNSTP